MKTNLTIISLFLFIPIILFAQDSNFPIIKIPPQQGEIVPNGWFKAGSNSQDYLVGLDYINSQSGKSSAYIESKNTNPQGFCTLMQEINADNYRGDRLEFSAYVKSQFVSGWAGLWMRVEGADDIPLGFDNMEKRPVIGSSDWIKYHIVLDVPYNAIKIIFGISLHGKGKVWIDNAKINSVGREVPVTDTLQSPAYKSKNKPQNLDFEH
jgi:hypothetical protein